MQVQTTTSSPAYDFQTKSEASSHASSSRNMKNAVQININQGLNNLCECRTPAITDEGSKKPFEMEALFTELKTIMQNFFNEIKILVKESLGEIKNMITMAFPSSKPAEETTLPVEGGSQALSWQDKALEYIRPGSSGLVTEGELQEALVTYQLYEKGSRAESLFREKLQNAKENSSAVQANIRSSLERVVAEGLITREEADSIYSIAHRAAQLDDSVGAISNVRSNGASVADAIKTGGDNLARIRNGEMEYTRRSI
jgi:hypothetical protein